MPTPADALLLANRALSSVFNEDPEYGEVLHLAAIGKIETSWGSGWKGAGKGSNNIGAIQCGSSWKGAKFSYTDTTPQPDGSSKTYVTNFRKYNTPLDGWIDLAKVAYSNMHRNVVREAAKDMDTPRVSKLLYDTHYYEGWGATPAIRIQHHLLSMVKAIKVITAQPMVNPTHVTHLPPTVRRGHYGEAVKLLQSELRLAADGIFGPITEAALVQYQLAHGLKGDGIAGIRTWTALFADDYQPSLKV